MASGRSTQLAGQLGEYLVAAQLCRLNLVAATFSGNVQHFDILASDANGRAHTVQVKTIRGRDWQLNAAKFLDIDLVDGNRQIVRGRLKEPIPGLMCVFVRLGEDYRADEYYVLTWLEVQDIVDAHYRQNLEKHGGIRPKNAESRHTSFFYGALQPYRDAWHKFDIGAAPA